MNINANLIHLNNLIKHDLRAGILTCWKKYAAAACVFIMITTAFMTSIRSARFVNLLHGNPNAMDFLIYMFQGMKEYNPADGKKFDIPVVWLIINLYLAFIIGNYPLKDLYGIGQTMLTRSQKRSYWWAAKCVWVLASVLCYYVVLYGCILVASLSCGGLSLQPSQDISIYYYGCDFTNVNLPALAAAVLLLPLITSMALCLLQTTLSFLLSPIYAYLCITALLVVSAFYMTPCLPGNCSMLLRNSIAADNGISTVQSAAVTLSLSVVAVIAGGIYWNRCDILRKT